MKATRHYDEWAWVDFVRGISRGEVRSAMERHLSSGCQRCAGIVRVLSGVVEAGKLEAGYEPSPHVLRQARAIFPVRRPKTSLVARLIYDSFREPLPAGIRAQDRLTRHALYEAGSVFVDLQLEHDRASGLVTLVGQISDRADPGVKTASLPVSLTAGKGLVASAVCNRLGEFELEYRPARDLRLYVPLLEAGTHVDVRLDELSPLPKRARAARAATVRRRRARSTEPQP